MAKIITKKNNKEGVIMISPNDIKKIDNTPVNIDDIIGKIDKSIVINHRKYNYEYAELNEIYPQEVIQRIVDSYIEAGWKHIYHITIIDKKPNGNKKTIFKFSMHALNEEDHINLEIYCHQNNYSIQSKCHTVKD